MADWNAWGAMQAVRDTILGARPGTTITFGAPLSVSGRVVVYLCLLPTMSTPAASSGLRDRTIRIFIGFAYRLDPSNPAAAGEVEQQVATLADLFLNAFETDRSLGGAISGGAIEEDATRQPTYATFATQEFRVLPFVLTGTQTKTFIL
jgi:hypothetical protein